MAYFSMCQHNNTTNNKFYTMKAIICLYFKYAFSKRLYLGLAYISAIIARLVLVDMNLRQCK